MRAQRTNRISPFRWAIFKLNIAWLCLSCLAIGICGPAAHAQTGSTKATANSTAKPIEYAIAIHGGAGWEPAKLSAADRRQHEQSLTTALDVGRKMLAAGGSAMEAVEQTIRVLEDEPLYNAGRGAVYNNVGQHELDAAIMDGRSRTAGAVAGLTTVKNPISLARLVMSETKHVLLIGSGAEKFADEMRGKPQIERVPNSYFDTEFRRREWEEAVRQEKAAAAERAQPGASSSGAAKGTVGCVAFDRHGNLAAGTSTGGLTNKKWGRVGAVPIIGAGTYADNRSCAISGTGTGEVFLLNSAAFQVHMQMLIGKQSLVSAVTELIDKTMPEDSGGIIAIDAAGHIFMRCNTPGMARAAADSSGKLEILIDR